MVSCPITSWQIDGETAADFILGVSKLTADGDCSHEIKRCLLLGRKAMTNLKTVLKSRDITLLTKVCIVKVVVFPVVMHKCEMDILSCSSANKKKQTNKKPRGGKDVKILSIIYPEEIQAGSLMEATNLKSFPLCK